MKREEKKSPMSVAKH